MKLSDIPGAIKDARQARRALWLVGEPGVGKTAIVHQAAELLGIDLTVMRASLYDSVDFGGLPVPNRETNQIERYFDFWMPQPDTDGILFIDELGQAGIEIQCAAMRLVDNLPEGWQVVAASNRVTDRAGVKQSPTHVLTRFTHLNIDADREGWQKWALTSGIHHYVRGFIDFRPQLLMPAFNPSQVQIDRTCCNPRSWEGVSNIQWNCRSSILDEMVVGTVGQGAGAEYLGYVRIAKECLPPDEILKDPKNAAIPKDPSSIIATCAALSDRARSMDKKELGLLWDYTARLPVEYAAFLVIDVQSIHESFMAYPVGSKWILAHRELIIGTRA